MPRQNLNVEGKNGGGGRKKWKVRKRGGSSSSSSSLVPKNGLKRALFIGKTVGSTTPMPMWKMMSSKSSSMENDEAKYLSVSARKLAATLWGIKGVNEEGIVGKERGLDSFKLGSNSKLLALPDLFPSPVFERMDTVKVSSHGRRASAGSQKLLGADFDFEVGQKQNNLKNRLKDVLNNLITSKQLLKIMSRICYFDQLNSTSVSVFSAMKFELNEACAHVGKLVQEQRSNWREIDNFLQQFEEEKVVWKRKEQETIRSTIAVVIEELESERKLRQQTERLNKKLGMELAQTKLSLSKTNRELKSVKRAHEVLEQAYDELERGIGEDQAEVEEMKRQSERVCEELEKEREMLLLTDVLREEHVQMKLSDAKFQYDEKNVLIDRLRSELESYLKSKTGEEQPDDSPSNDKINELKKYLRETLPGSYKYEDRDKEDDGSSDSDLHSIELNVDDIDKSCVRINKPIISSEAKSAEWVFSTDGSGINKPIISSEAKSAEWVFSADGSGIFEFASAPPLKKDVEDEMERYNMIKDLRDSVVLGSRLLST